MNITEIAREIDRGMIPTGVYNDEEVFQLERERIFAKTWVFLGHESEVPEPGDYVVRRILDDSFIVTRDEHGELRVLLNMCLHRGMQVCRAERGNASHFRCPYHAWTYKNSGELVGLPFHRDAYGGEDGLRKGDKSLRPAPRFDTYRGLVFASINEDAPDLADFLGDFRFFIDFYFGQSREGSTVVGPQRFVVRANWKIAVENFAGDTYHTPHTHASIVDIGLFREPTAGKRKLGAMYHVGHGAGTTYKLPATDFERNLEHVGYPPEMIARMREVWTPAQQALVGDAGFMASAASLLPNISFIHNWPHVDADGPVVPFVSIRLWQPLGPGETEVLSWFAVDRNAPESFREASRRAYISCFGSSGMFEQDDVENWASITRAAKGTLARDTHLINRMGMSADGGLIHEPLADWPAPGRAFTGFGEYNQRDLLRIWARWLCEGEPDPNGAGPVVTTPEIARAR